MGRKETLQLLSPTLLLLLLALAAAFGPRLLQPKYDFEKQKRFLEEVESGQLDFSRDRAVEILRLMIRSVDSERAITERVIGLIEYLGYVLFGLVALQMWIVIQVRTRLRQVFPVGD